MNRFSLRILTSFCLLSSLVHADETSSWTNRLRVNVLNLLDQFLGWTLDDSMRSYTLKDPLRGQTIDINLPALVEFEKNHGYFSTVHPLVGSVSTDETDLQTTIDLFLSIDQGLQDPEQRFLAISEILTKVLAFRGLKVGTEIPIPSVQPSPSKPPLYRVDAVFDLWHGMPAFGLVPVDASQGSPILLYRGTDFSLMTEQSWASVISDLDIRKAGFSVFQNARPKLVAWLTQVKGAQVMGFSLGGALAAYLAIYEHQWIKAPSIAFNPAGISQEAFEKGFSLPSEAKNLFTTFVTQGDPASNTGYLWGKIQGFRLPIPLNPIATHTTLITAHPTFRINLVKKDEF